MPIVSGMDTAALFLVFSMHRPETLELSLSLMRQCDTIILEEAPQENFSAMLTGEVGLEQYLQESEAEYPEFARRQYAHMRQLHAEGKILLQSDPYIKLLIEIHTFFGEGNGPADIDRDSLHHEVYRCEHEATRRLLDFYSSMAASSFEEIISHVIQFGWADSERIRLRDTLRAEEILQLLPPAGKIFIEAGPIHRGLEKLLRPLPTSARSLHVISIEDMVCEKLYRSTSLLSPGDEYTLDLVNGEEISEEQSRLLCARALVYNKIITKDEILASPEEYPHISEEQSVVKLVSSLDYQECEKLFSSIRFLSTTKSRETVQHYVEQQFHRN